MRYSFTRKVQVALLMLGSAILLFSCESTPEAAAESNDAHLMSEYSEDMSIVMSQNGRRSYFFETPLLEGYTLGQEPYREFRKGIKITTYQDDSLSQVDLVLTANYAIYYEKRELWEAKGDVVGRKFDGKQLYTQQLFWDARTQKVYSNVDTKLVQGNNVSVGESFEANEDLSDWRFRYQKSRVEVEFKPGTGRDTTATDVKEEAPKLKERPQSGPISRVRPATDSSTARATSTTATPRRTTPKKRAQTQTIGREMPPALELNARQKKMEPIRREAALQADEPAMMDQK